MIVIFSDIYNPQIAGFISLSFSIIGILIIPFFWIEPILARKFSEKIKIESMTLKRFLHKNLYQHPDVKMMTDKAVNVISNLFEAYLNDINLLPKEYLKYNLEKINNKSKERVISDYIDGMTDRFALEEYKKLYGDN